MSDTAPLAGIKLVRNDGTTVDGSSLKGKYVGLYFSAHWCPPCRAFTPQLATWYQRVAVKREDLEVVFMSSDQDEESWREYFATMPWLAVPFGERGAAQKVRAHQPRFIPCLVLLDPEGKVVVRNAVGSVKSDPEGERFPWEGEEAQSGGCVLL